MSSDPTPPEPSPSEPRPSRWVRPLGGRPLTPELEHLLVTTACMQVYEARVQALTKLVEQLAELCGALAAAGGVPDAREHVSAAVFRGVYAAHVRAAEEQALKDLEAVSPAVAARFQAELGRDLPPA